MEKTTLEDIQRALHEAFGGDYAVAYVHRREVEPGISSVTYGATSKAEREGTDIPLKIAKKYLHCGGCSACQGEAPDGGT